MKIRIYEQDADASSLGGGSPLTPTRCEITANLNSDWTLTLEHPLDRDGMYRLIQSGAVLRVPAFNGSQLYRIITADRTDSGVTATAEPIFMDALHDVFLMDSRPTNLSGQAALDHIMQGTKFSGKSDILNLNTAYYVRKNLIEALNGDDENAFTSRWGGEILFNNYQIVINRSAGRDKGVVVKYGRNLTGISETVDRSGLITRIIPIGYDGIMLSGNTPWVDSPIIDAYPIVYNSVIEYSDVKVKEDPEDDDGFATLAEAQAELTRLANLEYSQNNVDKELVSMDVDLILLQNTVEYAEFKNLEDVSLGDTVTCRHAKLGIDVSAKVVSLTWDCITGRVTAVTLGNFKQNYFSNNTNRVDQALGNASSAQNAAQKAQSVASGAQSVADQAQQAAGDAQSAANKANQNAQNAQTAAGNAQQTANGAQSTAENAQNAADKAQQTADDVSNLVDKVIRPNGTVIADRVQGIIDATLAQLHLQNTAAQKQNVRAILFEDLDPDSDLYGAISIGTQGWQIANERTSDGLDWNWKTAATANGIVADVISAGTLNGVTINADTGNIGGWTINQDSISKTVEFTDGTSYDVKLYGNAQEKVIEIGMTGQDPQYILYSDGRVESMAQLASKEMVCSPFPDDWGLSSNESPFFMRCSYQEGGGVAYGRAIRFTKVQTADGATAAFSPYTDSDGKIDLGAKSLPYHYIFGTGLYLKYHTLDNSHKPIYENLFSVGENGLYLYEQDYLDGGNPSICLSITRSGNGYNPGLLSLYDTYTGGQVLAFRVDPVDHYLSMYNSTPDRTIYLNASAGAATFKGSVTCSFLSQTSDARLKKNIEMLDSDDCKNFILALKPRKFEFLDKADNETHAGFVAQEVAEIQAELGVEFAEEREIEPPDPDVPSMVLNSDEPQTEWTINYSSIIAPLVAVVQSQQAEIDILKQKLSELEAKIT